MEIKQEIKNSIGILHLNGDDKLTDKEYFTKKLEEIGQKTNYRLILDLSEIEYLHSSFIGILLLFSKKVKENNGDCVISGIISEFVRHEIEMTKLNKIFKTTKTVDAAMQIIDN